MPSPPPITALDRPGTGPGTARRRARTTRYRGSPGRPAGFLREADVAPGFGEGLGLRSPGSGGASGTPRLGEARHRHHHAPAPAIQARRGRLRRPRRRRQVPSRIATKVPASTSALPPTSSSACRCWGSSAYLTSPEEARMRPDQGTAPQQHRHRLSPEAEGGERMMVTSEAFTRRVRRALRICRRAGRRWRRTGRRAG